MGKELKIILISLIVYELVSVLLISLVNTVLWAIWRQGVILIYIGVFILGPLFIIFVIFMIMFLTKPGFADGVMCFIATAAYGTSMCNELDILRNFRDTTLINNTIGNLIVKTYYKTSPPIANFISHFNILRWVVRQFLKPIIFIVKRYNEWRR